MSQRQRKHANTQPRVEPTKQGDAKPRQRRLARVAGASLSVAVIGSACGGAQSTIERDRKRDYKIGKYEKAPQPTSQGSLWQNSNRGLFADFRASRVGDLVTIRITESTRAQGDASTDMTHAAEASFGVPKLLGIMSTVQSAYPDLDPEQLMRVIGGSSFKADGQTGRNNRVQGTIAVRVKKQLPNYDLFIEGTKVVQINNEELFIYVSGVVRQEDIQDDNTVESGLIADAEVRLTGDGDLSKNQEQGWLGKLLSEWRLM